MCLAVDMWLQVVSRSETESRFRGFPDLAFTPQFNLALECQDDSKSD